MINVLFHFIHMFHLRLKLIVRVYVPSFFCHLSIFFIALKVSSEQENVFLFIVKFSSSKQENVFY